MPRSALVLLCCVAGLTAAPVPKGLKKPAPDYYPSALGTKWVYVTEDGQEDHTREVTASQEADGVTSFTITKVQAGSTQTWDLKKDATGVVRLKQNGLTFDPPTLLLRPTMTEGDEWTSEFKYGGTAWTDARSLGKAETVKTPAGEFTAYPLTSRQNGGTSTLWYAAGVGMVKFQLDGGPVCVLREFTPGKK